MLDRRPDGPATSESPTIVLSEDRRGDRERLGGWDPERLDRSRVVVVGAGAIGNEVVKNLALIGVGSVLVIDFDRVAPSNLTRCVLFRDEDVGRPKARVVADRASRLNPAVTVEAVDGDIEFDVGESTLRIADVVIGCVDNAYARFVIDRRTRSVRRGWIDTGISMEAAQVSCYGPDTACYACGAGSATIEQLRARFSCTGLRRQPALARVPTTVIGASVAGAVATHRAVGVLHGGSPWGHRWTHYIGPGISLFDDLTVGLECPNHDRVRRRAEAPIGGDIDESFDHVGRALSNDARLSLKRPVLTGFECRKCRHVEELVAVLARVDQGHAVCPKCGEVRIARTVTVIRAGSPLAARPLRELGYASGDVLDVRVGRRRRSIGLAGLPGWTTDP